MPVIRPTKDLGTHASILNDISNSHPMFLTKNGYGKYVILDMKDYHALLPDNRQSHHTDTTLPTPHINKTTDQWLDEERLKRNVQISKSKHR